MRNFKKEVLNFLEQDDFEKNLKDIHKFPPKKVVNALLSFLVSTNKILKKHTIIAMGEVVSRLAEEDIESARIVMRRLMLSVTEESGGIGWNTPEAMGEIMARSEQLANEYHKILISYTIGGDNELDFEGLQISVIAGLKRLAEVYPNMVKEVNHLLK
ncbi:DVU0298 family protein [Bacteroidota bacterium]